MRVFKSGLDWLGNDQVTVLSQLTSTNNQGVEASITALPQRDQDVRACMESVRFSFVSGSKYAEVLVTDGHIFWNLQWQPGLDLLSLEQVHTYCKASSLGEEEPIAFFETLTLVLFASLFRMQRKIREIDVSPLPGHLRQYLDWAREQIQQYQEKTMDEPRLSWQKLALDDTFFFPTVCRDVESVNAQGRVYVAAGPRLTRILRFEFDTLELLFTSELLADLYQELSNTPTAFKSLQCYLAMYAHENPQARYLEIGAGTGGYTRNIFEPLTSRGDSGLEPAFYAEVDIEAQAIGLKFKDCLIALSCVGDDPLANECSGS